MKIAIEKGTKIAEIPKDYMLHVRMDTETLEHLDRMCSKKSLSRSEIVRDVIEREYRANHEIYNSVVPDGERELNDRELNLKVPSDLYEKLKGEANSKKTSISAIVRTICVEYFDKKSV